MKPALKKVEHTLLSCARTIHNDFLPVWKGGESKFSLVKPGKHDPSKETKADINTDESRDSM